LSHEQEIVKWIEQLSVCDADGLLDLSSDELCDRVAKSFMASVAAEQTAILIAMLVLSRGDSPIRIMATDRRKKEFKVEISSGISRTLSVAKKYLKLLKVGGYRPFIHRDVVSEICKFIDPKKWFPKKPPRAAQISSAILASGLSPRDVEQVLDQMAVMLRAKPDKVSLRWSMMAEANESVAAMLAGMGDIKRRLTEEVSSDEDDQ